MHGKVGSSGGCVVKRARAVKRSEKRGGVNPACVNGVPLTRKWGLGVAPPGRIDAAAASCACGPCGGGSAVLAVPTAQ